MRTKTDDVASYLKTHKRGITQREAIDKFQVYRLASIIYNLKTRRGMDIRSEDIKIKNRYGHPTVFTRYVLHEVSGS